MSEHEQRETEQLEAVLKALKPARPNLDRDRLMFRAGQASRPKRSLGIPALTAMIGLLAGIGGTYLGLQSPPTVVQQVVYVHVKEPAEQPPPEPSPKTPEVKQEVVQNITPESGSSSQTWWNSLLLPAKTAGGYVGLRDDVLRWGVDMLPEPPASGYTGSTRGPSTVGQLNAELESLCDF